MDQVIESYSQDERDHETDEDEVDTTAVKLSDALEALATLRLYEEQQENGNRDLICQLNRLERSIKAREPQSLQQRTITSYFV